MNGLILLGYKVHLVGYKGPPCQVIRTPLLVWSNHPGVEYVSRLEKAAAGHGFSPQQDVFLVLRGIFFLAIRTTFQQKLSVVLLL